MVYTGFPERKATFLLLPHGIVFLYIHWLFERNASYLQDIGSPYLVNKFLDQASFPGT